MGVSEIMYSYGLCLISILLIIVLSYLQLKINKSNLRQCCMLMITCALISNISIMFQIINVFKYNTIVIFEAFKYIGLTILPICQYFAVSYFIDSDFKFKKRYALFFVVPIILIISILTNNMHHLVYKYFSTRYGNCKYGIIFYIGIINIYITYLMSIYIFVRYRFFKEKKSNKFSNQIVFIIIALLMPYLFHLMCISKIIYARTYIDGVLQSVSAIIVIGISLRYQLLTQIPMTLTNILNTISDAYVIINGKKEIITYNKVFLDMYNLGKLNIRKMDISELIEYKEFDTISDEDITNILSSDDVVTFDRNSKVLKSSFRYRGKLIENKRERLYVISVSDITQYTKDIQNIKLNHDAILGRERLASLRSNDWRNCP